jgi:hypothetical protein
VRYLTAWRLPAAPLLAIGLLTGCGAAAPLAAHSLGSSRSIPGTGASARPPFLPLSFTAISVTRWWVLGAVPCGARDCLAIRTTTDGGTTFRSLPAPPGTFWPTAPGAAPTVSSISFADAKDGWVWGPQLYATHDGGLHWTAIRLPGAVLELEPGLSTVYAAVFPATPCTTTGTCTARTPQPQLWRSQPSGDTWSVDPAAGGVGGSLAVHGRSVWVVNTIRTHDGPVLGTGLLHSANAGRTFALEPQQVTGIICNYSPVSNSFLWAYCSGGHFMFPFVSSDGGAHFKAVGTQAALITPVGYPNGAELIAASAATAVAASSVPESKLGIPLIRTTDEGAHWKVVQAQPGSNGNWSLIGFTTPEVGYAFWQNFGGRYETAQLWHTTNGGATWARVKAVN